MSHDQNPFDSARVRAALDAIPEHWKTGKLLDELCTPELWEQVLKVEQGMGTWAAFDLIYSVGPQAVAGHKSRHGNPSGRPEHPAAELWVKLTYRLMTRPRFQAMPERKRMKAARIEAAELIDARFKQPRRRSQVEYKFAPLLGSSDDRHVSGKFKSYRDQFPTSG